MFNSSFVLTLLRIGALIVFIAAIKDPGFVMSVMLADLLYLGIWLHAEYENFSVTKDKFHRLVDKLIGKTR